MMSNPERLIHPAGSSAANLPKVAVVGCGYWGKNLVRDFAALGALAAVVDDNPAVRETLAAQHGARGADLADVLADETIAGLVIATPAETHHAIAMCALGAGKHVYVEKPLALNSTDGAQMAQMAASTGRILMVGHLLQYHPAFIELKRLIDAGTIGKLTYVYSNRLSHGIVRREEDVLWSFAPHDISMILALAGEAPHTVAAAAAPTLHPTIGDHCQVTMQFASGLRGHVFCSWLHPFKEQRLVVIGEKGSLVFEDSVSDPAMRLRHYDSTVEWQNGRPVAVKAKVAGGTPIPFGDANPLKSECAHFLECIAEGLTPRTNGTEGLRVLGVLERAALALVGEASQTSTAPCLDDVKALHRASANGDISKIEELVAMGCLVDAPDDFGRTPLMTAIRYSDICTVSKLIDLGASVQARNINGTTPMMYAKTKAMSNGNIDIMKLLRRCGARTDEKDNSGNSAVFYLEKNYQTVKEFLESNV